MGKTAVVFPGQGVQAVGMGKEIHDAFPEAREIMDRACEVLGMDLKALMFEGPLERLTETANAQPAILTVNYAFFRLARQAASAAFDGAAGHSLGEYNALVAAGAMRFEDALRAVRERGRLMQEVGARTQGTMAAVLGLDEALLQEVCRRASAKGPVEISNFNCPGQLVISGEVNALEEACVLAKEAGAKRAIRLRVGGAFHSSLLKEASERFAPFLEGIRIEAPRCDLYTNVTGERASDPGEIRSLLTRQLSSPVLWERILRGMIRDGYDTFTEFGPGRVLAGLIAQIDGKVRVASVNGLASLGAP